MIVCFNYLGKCVNSNKGCIFHDGNDNCIANKSGEYYNSMPIATIHKIEKLIARLEKYHYGHAYHDKTRASNAFNVYLNISGKKKKYDCFIAETGEIFFKEVKKT